MFYLIILIIILFIFLEIYRKEKYTNYKNIKDLAPSLDKKDYNSLLKIPSKMSYILDNSDQILRSAGRILYKANSLENNYNNYTLHLKNKNSEREKNDRIIYDQHKRIHNNNKIIKYIYDKHFTNRRLNYFEIKNDIKNKKKFSCMKMSVIIALIMLIIPLMTFLKLINGSIPIIIYIIGVAIIFAYNLFCLINFDRSRDDQYYNENNFTKPTEEEISRSRMQYEKDKAKYANIHILEEDEHESNNINLNIKNYINTKRCNVRN